MSSNSAVQRLLTKYLKVLVLLTGLLFSAQSLHSQIPISQLKEKVTINISNANAASVLQSLQQKTSYTFTFDTEALRSLVIKKVEFGNAELGAVLKYLQVNYGLQFSVASNKNISVLRGNVVKEIEKGTVAGKIIDEENGQPVPDATILIGKHGTRSGVDGSFTISLPKGKYEAEISSVGYGSKIVSEIDVKDNQVFELNVTLKRNKGQLSAVVVRATASKESIASLYVRQKNNTSISDGISQEQIRRTPDNNVAQVLKRVSGLTVQDNKFVTVRGMSERYNNVQLNGAILPSTEPNRRNFSFDIIPSNLVDNVVVNKTFTPDLPGEFSGGLVQVNTIDIPSKTFITVGAGSGFNTNSIGKDFKSTKRYSADYLGGSKDRSWFNRRWDYNAYNQVYDPTKLNVDETVDKMSSINKNIPNHWGLQRYTAKPVQNYQLAFGKPFRLKNANTIALILSASYRHEENIENFYAYYRNEDSTIGDSRKYGFMTSLGGIGNLAWQSKKHKLVWRNLYNKRFTHNTTEQMIDPANQPGSEYEYYSTVLMNTLWQTRLEGTHQLFKGFKVDWFADYNKLEREQPDDRFSKGMIRRTDPATGKPLVQYNLVESFISWGGLFSSNLEEKKKNAGADFSQTFKISDRNQLLKAGYWGTFRNADYQQVGLRPLLTDTRNANNDEIYGKIDYQIYDPANFANGLLYYRIAYPSGSSSGDAYSGRQQVHAGYLMADLNPVNKLRVIGGARYEKAVMDVKTITRVETGDPGRPMEWKDTTVRYSEAQWLPSVSLIYSLTPKINIRAGYSKTVARPDFRERSAYQYYDVLERASIRGNGGLKQSYTSNYDVRFEWYPRAGEVVSVSGFYKKFINPVELVSYISTSANYILFYFNLDNSNVKGIEADFRKSLGFINRQSRFLGNLYVSGNATWMEGTVNYNPQKLMDQAQGLRPDQVNPDVYNAGNRNRPLMGLSPYIINAGLNYQDDLLGINLTYNRYGRRLTLAGLVSDRDEYENPRDVLDAQISLRLMKQKLELRFNAADILNQRFVIYRNVEKSGLSYDDPQGMKYNPDSDWTLYKGKRGTNYSFTIAYRFD